MAAPNQRGGSGRKKTVIRRIEQDDAPHVQFSNGRMGFFSKASNLAVLTGAQVAALTSSPGGNAFSFDHPSVDPVVERFLVGESAGAGASEEVSAGEDQKLEKLHQEFNELRKELVEVKKRTEREEVTAKLHDAGEPIAAWVDPNVRDMGDEDMAAFFVALMQVKDIASERANQVPLHVDEEGAVGENKKLEKLHQEFDELRTELVEVKKRTERKQKVMAKERDAGD
ncbi:agamous-like MADS-box protein AGL29 [Triticum aestivum]|uniref:agamous-like MADS-box protein AGL29 n=1 Tax=Triticum aestivum TaxID=4565 RepID=UPI001D022079|nr:agamous-like MADS-box protein AGL29 [Triticum aestivum]